MAPKKGKGKEKLVVDSDSDEEVKMVVKKEPIVTGKRFDDSDSDEDINLKIKKPVKEVKEVKEEKETKPVKATKPVKDENEEPKNIVKLEKEFNKLLTKKNALFKERLSMMKEFNEQNSIPEVSETLEELREEIYNEMIKQGLETLSKRTISYFEPKEVKKDSLKQKKIDKTTAYLKKELEGQPEKKIEKLAETVVVGIPDEDKDKKKPTPKK